MVFLVLLLYVFDWQKQQESIVNYFIKIMTESTIQLHAMTSVIRSFIFHAMCSTRMPTKMPNTEQLRIFTTVCLICFSGTILICLRGNQVVSTWRSPVLSYLNNTSDPKYPRRLSETESGRQSHRDRRSMFRHSTGRSRYQIHCSR